MSRSVVSSWQRRRRAIVGGRALDAAGRPFRGPARLVLNGVPPGRRFECHMRPDGRFFFLDVPPGQYSLDTLDRCDDDAKVLQARKLVVAPYADGTRMPSVWVDLEVMDAGRAP